MAWWWFWWWSSSRISYCHHDFSIRLAWSTLGRDVEYALKIGEQQSLDLWLSLLDAIIDGLSFLSDCFIIIIRKWAEAHEQLPEGQHDDTSALLQHHEEVFSCYIWWCVLILNIYWHDTSAYFKKNYSQHFIKLKEPTFASLTRFAGILTKWWSISKMKNGLSGQGKLYQVINLRNVLFQGCWAVFKQACKPFSLAGIQVSGDENKYNGLNLLMTIVCNIV